MATIIILAVIVSAVVLAVAKIIKDKKNGKCTGCSCSGTCQKKSCNK